MQAPGAGFFLRWFWLTIGGLPGGLAPPSAVYGGGYPPGGGVIREVSPLSVSAGNDASGVRRKRKHTPSGFVKNTAGVFCFEKRPPRQQRKKAQQKYLLHLPLSSVALDPLTSLHCTAEVTPPEVEVTRRLFVAGGVFVCRRVERGPKSEVLTLNPKAYGCVFHCFKVI